MMRFVVGGLVLVCFGCTELAPRFEIVPPPIPGPTDFREVCPAGTRPVLGQAGCVGVGWLQCPTGFVPDVSGWGCVDVSPPDRCAGATREAIGQATCVPVGDCAAAFPPAQARYFVDGAGPVDATHFRTISQALEAAPDDATIAVGAGTYPEVLELRKPVKLVGRCAQQVTLVSRGDRNGGLLVLGTEGSIEVSGFTISGFVTGAYVDYQSTLVVRDSVFDRNREVGVYVSGQGKLVLERSIVRDTKAAASGQFGFGAYVENGASLELTASSLVGNRYAGLWLPNPGGQQGGHAVLVDALIARTAPAGDGRFGDGVLMDSGATLDATRSAFVANSELGLSVSGARARATLTDSVVRDTQPRADGAGGGVEVSGGASLELTRCAIARNSGIGVGVFHPGTVVTMASTVVHSTQATSLGTDGRGVGVTEGARLVMTDSALVNNQLVALFVAKTGTFAGVEGSLVRDTRPTPTGGYGRGVNVQTGARLELTKTALLNNRDVGLGAFDDGTSLVATAVLVLDTAAQEAGPSVPGFGYGVLANRGSVSLTRSVVRRSAAVGAFYSGATGQIVDGLIGDNVIGVHVQDDSQLRQVEVAAPLVPLEVQVTSSTQFVNNGSKVGGGALPLPGSLAGLTK